MSKKESLITTSNRKGFGKKIKILQTQEIESLKRDLAKLQSDLNMSDKEILSIRVMGRDISIACPPEDKPLLLEASTILNKEIEQIPDKGNALILAALNLAFQSKGTQVSDDDSNKINQIISSIDDALN